MTPPAGSGAPHDLSVEQMTAIANVAAKVAAKEAVKDTFYLIGINIDDRDALDAYQADRAYTRRQRLTAEARSMSLSTGLVLALVSAFVTGGVAWLTGLIKLGGRL